MSAEKELVLGYSPWGNTTGDIRPFDEVFDAAQNITVSMAGVNAVIFWGGTDIDPAFYGQKAHLRNQAPTKRSPRDEFEWKAMHYCLMNKIPMIGVCRGAQMLCAFAGGKLVQHMSGHHGDHNITLDTGEIIMSTSSHHQMMYPWDVPHQLIAHSTVRLSSTYEEAVGETIPAAWGHVEPEIVYFPAINGLAIQGHPEWACTKEYRELCIDLVLEQLTGLISQRSAVTA